MQLPTDPNDPLWNYVILGVFLFFLAIMAFGVYKGKKDPRDHDGNPLP